MYVCLNSRYTPLAAPAAVSSLTENILAQGAPFPPVLGTDFVSDGQVRGQFELSNDLFQSSTLLRDIGVKLRVLVDITDGDKRKTCDNQSDRLFSVDPYAIISPSAPTMLCSCIEAIRDVVLLVVFPSWQRGVAMAM
jgi:hypothetical protein